MYLSLSLLLLSVVNVLGQKVVIDYPTLPSMWTAETIEPGAPGNGDGLEAYNFVENPTDENPSAMWSNYTDCQRLIYVPHTNNAKRYLLGCDAVNCCWEEQSGNQVEFQIPNVHYSNPSKKVDVSWQKATVTNFGKEVEADEWSWSWTIKDTLSQDWRAYTIPCADCVNEVELIQWQSRAMGSEWFGVEFKGYRGINSTSEDGENFKSRFAIPEICQKNNLLKCPSGLHEKYFEKKEEKCCETCEEGTDKYYSIPSKTDCGESCIAAKDYNKVHFFEWGLKKAETDTPCIDNGYTNYVKTETHNALIVNVKVDFYEPEKNTELNNKAPDCGVCGKAYQTCCIGFGAQGYPCDCHLEEGTGKSGENCGDCGVGFAGCCIGYAVDGYPCECDVA